METRKKEIEILNDLIMINNDRIKGYDKAMEELNDDGEERNLSVFADRVDESRRFRTQLSDAVIRMGDKPEEDASAPGAIYRMWMDMKTAFTGGDDKSVLELCEYGEDVALKAYEKAFEFKNWSADTLSMLNNQRMILQNAHNTIKARRDAAKAHAH